MDMLQGSRRQHATYKERPVAFRQADGEVWFKGSAVLPFLGMNASCQCHLPAEFRQVFPDGVYVRSDRVLFWADKRDPTFAEWLRKTIGRCAAAQGAIGQPRTFKMLVEADLHRKVVDFVRSKFPQVLLVAGLGELQQTSELRISSWQKGYTKGQCDLLLLSAVGPYCGMALEFKSPNGNGALSEEQKRFLHQLVDQRWRVLISNDYDEIVMEVTRYMDGWGAATSKKNG